MFSLSLSLSVCLPPPSFSLSLRRRCCEGGGGGGGGDVVLINRSALGIYLLPLLSALVSSFLLSSPPFSFCSCSFPCPRSSLYCCCCYSSSSSSFLLLLLLLLFLLLLPHMLTDKCEFASIPLLPLFSTYSMGRAY